MDNEYHLLEVRARQMEARISGALRSVGLMEASMIDDLHDHPNMSPPELVRLMDSYLKQFPEVRSFFIVDRAGRVKAVNTAYKSLIGFDAVTREYFKFHQAAPQSDGFHVSLPFTTASGTIAITLSKVVRDHDGKFAGVVVAGLGSSFFAEAQKTEEHDKGLESVVIHSHGEVLNFVPHTQFIGKSLIGGIAYTEHLAVNQPTTRHLNTTKLDKVRKLGLFQNVQNAPLVVIVSRNYDNVMGDWLQTAYFHVGGYALLALTTLLLLGLASRRQNSLLDVQHKLQSKLVEINQLQIKLQEQVIRDPLTGLHNRRHLDEVLPRELARAKREGYSMALVMVDLDHFKQVNDTYGHAAGDEVLKSLSLILTDKLRESDIVCRYGGEEFFVAMPRMAMDQAQIRVEEWRSNLARTVVKHGDLSVTVTLSAGIACFPDHGGDVDTLVSTADKALYQSKNQGRNRVTCCTST